MDHRNKRKTGHSTIKETTKSYINETLLGDRKRGGRGRKRNT